MNNQPSIWIGTSWKMNKTLSQASDFVQQLIQQNQKSDPRIQRFVIPSFTTVREVKQALTHTDILVGAQNMHWKDQGAWTGEVSPTMLTDCNLDIVEIGHSERREHFGETNQTVALKTESAVRHNLTPLVCIGETLTQRESGNAQNVLADQVKSALSKLSSELKQSPILFAYEPVWAIGENGIPATSEYADARQAEIINVASNELGRKVPCLYGGSVNPANCAELIRCAHIDGLFIGRSAWSAAGYLNILNICASAL